MVKSHYATPSTTEKQKRLNLFTETSSILLWNSLPVKLRSSESINAFKRTYIKYVKKGYANIDHFPTQYF